MATLEFFFDISSPWTYLAFERIEGVAERSGAELIWKPFLVGGVFNKVNPSVYQRRENPVPVKVETTLNVLSRSVGSSGAPSTTSS